MNKIMRVLLLVCFGSSLCFLLLRDFFSAVAELSVPVSVLEYPEVENGVYDSSVIGFSLDMASDPHAGNLDISNYCNCSSRLMKNRSENRNCSQIATLFPLQYVDNGGNVRTSFNSLLFVEAPKDFGRCELIVIKCEPPVKSILWFQTIPITWNDFVAVVANHSEAIEMYERHFDSRPQLQTPGGHKILVKLSEQRFEDRDGVMRDGDRFIKSTVSVARVEEQLYIEAVVAWENSVTAVVRTLTATNYLAFVKYLATFLLTAEKIFYFYTKFIK